MKIEARSWAEDREQTEGPGPEAPGRAWWERTTHESLTDPLIREALREDDTGYVRTCAKTRWRSPLGTGKEALARYARGLQISGAGKELRGTTLVCGCRSRPCAADVLAALANGEPWIDPRPEEREGSEEEKPQRTRREPARKVKEGAAREKPTGGKRRRAGTRCKREGCRKELTIHAKEYCSHACWIQSRADARPTCDASGCTRKVARQRWRYCGKECAARGRKERHAARSLGVRAEVLAGESWAVVAERHGLSIVGAKRAVQRICREQGVELPEGANHRAKGGVGDTCEAPGCEERTAARHNRYCSNRCRNGVRRAEREAKAEMVQELREAGIGWREVAQAVGHREGTVRRWLRERLESTGEDGELMDSGTGGAKGGQCAGPGCGNAVYERRYCSPRCRWERAKAEHSPPRQCEREGCEEPIDPGKERTQRFCSRNCAMKSRRGGAQRGGDEAWRLHHQEGRGWGEIGARMQISPQAAAMRARRWKTGREWVEKNGRQRG